MPASMFSIDNILAARPRCKDSVLPVAPSSAAPVVFPALHGDSLYGAGGAASSDYGAFYPRPVAPGGAGLPAAVGGSRLGYNNYFYGQLHVQAAPVGPACCGAVPPLGAQQCSCVPAPSGRTALAPASVAAAALRPGARAGGGASSLHFVQTLLLLQTWTLLSSAFCFFLFSFLLCVGFFFWLLLLIGPRGLHTCCKLYAGVSGNCVRMGRLRLSGFPKWLWTPWHTPPFPCTLDFHAPPIPSTPLVDDF